MSITFPKDIMDCMKECILSIFWPKKDIVDFMKKIGYKKATLISRFPYGSFTPIINKCYEKYNTKDIKLIIERLKGDDIEWEQF